MSKKEQKKKRRGFIDYISLKTELPSDALAGDVRIEMRGKSSLYLGGCRKIVEYSPTLIILRIKGGDVGIYGENLICTSYYSGSVSVEGKILSVRFLEDGE